MDETLPVDERVRQARQVVAGALDAIEQLQSNQQDLYDGIEQLRDEIAKLEAQKYPLYNEMKRAKRLLAEAEKLTNRQLSLFVKGHGP